MNRREPMTEVALARSLDLIAKAGYGGHFTIFGFTGGFKVMFGTPYSRADIYNAVPGATLEEAVKNCIDDWAKSHPPNSPLYALLRQQEDTDCSLIYGGPGSKEWELFIGESGRSLGLTPGEKWTNMQLLDQKRPYSAWDKEAFPDE